MRAAAILYGDWGTSKAYVLGIAFALAGFSSFPILIAMAVLTALVGLNYYWICCQYPDGGGVYSAVRDRSRLIAVVGAMLLLADYLVTASLSVLEGFNYLSHLLHTLFGYHLPSPHRCAIGLLLAVGVLNWWGPRHSGTIAVFLAIPATLAASSVALLALPHLGEAKFVAHEGGFGHKWMLFAGIVLALSGVEAVSNMTGVMVADPKKNPGDHDTVKRTSAWTIGIVATEVVVLTILLAWAMHAVPTLDPKNTEAMLGQMALHFGEKTLGASFAAIYASVVGFVMALLLFSAGNTAIIGMIAVFYMMANDKEMPPAFGKLNKHGVPKLPLIVATIGPCLLLMIYDNVTALAALYAIGVVGAITINIGGCATNANLKLSKPVRAVMLLTALVMLAIWITVGYEKHNALVFAVTILAFGLLARSFVQERRHIQAQAELHELLAGELEGDTPDDDAPRVLVCLRGITDTLRFALEEARLRRGVLGVLYVREVNVMIPVAQGIESDPEAIKILEAVRARVGRQPFQFLYRTSPNPPATILEVATDWRADFLIIGATAEGALTHLLRGSIATTIAQKLPRNTRLLIYSWRAKKSKKELEAVAAPPSSEAPDPKNSKAGAA